MVYEFFMQYGWQLTLIAFSGIIILGILKFFNVFKKVEESKRKYVYAGVASGFSIVAAAIYLAAIQQFTAPAFLVAAVGIYALNQTLYSMYETYGLRVLLQKFGNFFIQLVAGKQLNTAKKKIEDTELIIDDITDKPSTANSVSGETDIGAVK